MTYTIKVSRKFWFSKKLKKVKGHLYLPKVELNGTPNSVPDGMMMVIFENETRKFIPTNGKTIDFSDGWFKQEVERVKEESQGKAEITSDIL